MHAFLGVLTIATCAGWLGGCGGAAPAPADPPSRTNAVPEAEIERLGFSIEPHQLGDPGIVERIRHRVRVKRWGKAYLSYDGQPIDVDAPRDTTTFDYLYPVIDATDAKFRVVVEDDRARYALWVEAKDTWETTLGRVWLATAGRDGRHAVASGSGFFPIGVVLEPGAPIEVGPKAPRRHVSLRDPDLAIEGTLDARVIGRVYVEPEGARHEHQMSRRSVSTWTDPKDVRSWHLLRAAANIRADKGPAAPILASVLRPIRVYVTKSDERWTQIEIAREYVRVRGFVPTTALESTDDVGAFGSIGHGSGFGMSHADRIDVPEGTCLFAAAEGEVVGVQLETHQRLGRKRTPVTGWSLVYINTPWHSTAFYIHDVGSDPAQPQWESCKKQ